MSEPRGRAAHHLNAEDSSPPGGRWEPMRPSDQSPAAGRYLTCGRNRRMSNKECRMMKEEGRPVCRRSRLTPAQRRRRDRRAGHTLQVVGCGRLLREASFVLVRAIGLARGRRAGRSALQHGRRRAAEYGRALGAVVVAHETARPRHARQRLRAVVIAGETTWLHDAGWRFGAIVVAAPRTNAVRQAARRAQQSVPEVHRVRGVAQGKCD
jgi:hypothetical protein